MTSIQFRNALRRLDCTISRAARLLGADERTGRRWASGERGIPETAAKLLRLAVAGKITLDDIESA